MNLVPAQDNFLRDFTLPPSFTLDVWGKGSYEEVSFLLQNVPGCRTEIFSQRSQWILSGTPRGMDGCAVDTLSRNPWPNGVWKICVSCGKKSNYSLTQPKRWLYNYPNKGTWGIDLRCTLSVDCHIRITLCAWSGLWCRWCSKNVWVISRIGRCLK